MWIIFFHHCYDVFSQFIITENALLVFISTGLLLILVVLLSLKLRADEMQTMFKIGCSRSTIALLQTGELVLVFLLSGLLLLVGLWLTNMFAADIVEPALPPTKRPSSRMRRRDIEKDS